MRTAPERPTRVRAPRASGGLSAGEDRPKVSPSLWLTMRIAFMSLPALRRLRVRFAPRASTISQRRCARTRDQIAAATQAWLLADGIWSHARPSSSRPAAFLRVPPHCLKKKGTPAATH